MCLSHPRNSSKADPQKRTNREAFAPRSLRTPNRINFVLGTRVSYFLAFLRRFVAFLAFFFGAFLAALRFFAMEFLLDWLMYCLGITCLDSAQPSACCWG